MSIDVRTVADTEDTPRESAVFASGYSAARKRVETLARVDSRSGRAVRRCPIGVYKRGVEWALFDGIAAEQTRALLSLARRRRFSRGEVVFHEGDPGDTLHLIERGHLAVRVTTPLGDTATLRILGPGEYFGEMAVVSPAPRSATITALELTETLALHRDLIDRLRLEHPDVDRVLLEAVVGEVRRMSAALLDAMYVSVPTRLARRLVSLARSYPPDAQGQVVIPLTQDDLAGLCGTTRPTVNQLLGKLADKQLIEVARGRVIITDLPGLARRAR